MICHRKPFVLSFVVAILFASSSVAAGVLEIAIKSNTVSLLDNGGSTSVTIADVAEVVGSTPQQRRRAAALDLDTLIDTNDSCHVSRSQIESRLLIAGFQRSDFQVIGVDRISVSMTLGNWLIDQLEPLLAREIARQFGLEVDAVTVHLTNEAEVRSD